MKTKISNIIWIVELLMVGFFACDFFCLEIYAGHLRRWMAENCSELSFTELSAYLNVSNDLVSVNNFIQLALIGLIVSGIALAITSAREIWKEEVA